MGKNAQNITYGLVGEKLGHSHSPFLHARFGEYDYRLIEVAKEEIEEFFEKAAFSGVNVTIPYKETAMRFCLPDETAKEIGCVNTLVRSGDRLFGYNTDTYGFEYMTERAGIDLSGKKTAILGSGGTCRTAAYTASRLGASSVTVISRKPKDMGLELSCPVCYVSYEEGCRECEILINTTPVGMYPGIEKTPIDITKDYVNLKAVIDVIYNPLSTRLSVMANKLGIKAACGLPMLVAQGYFASKLFTGLGIGKDPVGELSPEEKEKIESVIDALSKSVSNIVLIGMPGSGKSTVGRLIAKDSGLEFTDTDEMFEEQNSISPADCIRQNGEPAFRALEKKTVAAAAAKGGCVIATGGGVVLDPENMELLSLNGKVVYLHRKLSDLATDDRPLSEGAETLKALYYKRLPIYLGSCDIIVNVDGSAEDAAGKVMSSVFDDTGEEKMKILVMNGPNLNMLGIREPDMYGKETYDDLMKKCREKAMELGAEVDFYQSNHEGDLVDAIQQAYGIYDGIVINPGAYTHTSVAILDALKAVNIPAVEVHITDIDARDEFRKVSYIRSYVKAVITGHGLGGYTEAMEILCAK